MANTTSNDQTNPDLSVLSECCTEVNEVSSTQYFRDCNSHPGADLGSSEGGAKSSSGSLK